MKKLKEFFDKKQNDIKFKGAGIGHKLSDSTTTSNKSSSSSSSSSTSKGFQNKPILQSNLRRTGPDANVASAALARFEAKNNPNKPTTKPTLYDIMAEEKKKITEEIKLKEELEVFV